MSSQNSSSASGDSFLLQWQNFGDAFKDNLAAVLAQGQQGLSQQGSPQGLSLSPAAELPFWDVMLVPGDESDKLFKAHRVVLTAGSEYFKSALLNMARLCPGQTQPVLCLQGLTASDVESILEFLYLGKVHIDRNKLQHFIRVADTLKINGLNDASKPSPDHPPQALKRRQDLLPLPASLSSTSATSSTNYVPRPSKRPRVPQVQAKPEVDVKPEPEELLEEEEDEDVDVDDDEELDEDAGIDPTRFLQLGASTSTAPVAAAVPLPPSTSKNASTGNFRVLFSETSRCHFCRTLCPDKVSLRAHLRASHQPDRHSLCENCENFFHICAIGRHRNKCTESYQNMDHNERE